MIKNELIFLEPVFKETIWGGNRLKQYGYEIPSDHTGECWAISAHSAGDCVVREGVHKGKTLSELWENHKDLFGNLEGDKFPLLVKIIDATDDLSIQVHPDDAYAKEFENGSFGKTECWYILECDEDATIVIGHHANDKEELKEMIENKRWSEFIREIPIKKGDFFQIEPGCLHAIKGGTMILETQQSSDITYRVYDYDRLQDGSLRPLHVKQSIEVLTAPFKETTIKEELKTIEDASVTCLIDCPFYCVEKIALNGKAHMTYDKPFVNVSILDGQGSIDGNPVKKGDHFIVSCKSGAIEMEGKMFMIVSTV